MTPIPPGSRRVAPKMAPIRRKHRFGLLFKRIESELKPPKVIDLRGLNSGPITKSENNATWLASQPGPRHYLGVALLRGEGENGEVQQVSRSRRARAGPAQPRLD
jgi:hypothetical protein